MQLVRTLAAWRPDLTGYRDVEAAYRISLKSLARCHLELHGEIADLDAMIGAIVDELAPDLVACNSIGRSGAAQLLLTAGDNPERLRSEAGFAALCGVSPSRLRRARRCVIVSTAAATAPPTARCTSSPSAD
jgi:transposase